MCGIVGYVGPRKATPIIVEGLSRLEYRGYDSAGLAVMQDGPIEVRRDVGKLANLERMLAESPVRGNIGIGHTRWATHGVPLSAQCPPPRGLQGRSGGHPQRHRGKLPIASPGVHGGRSSFHLRDGH